MFSKREKQVLWYDSKVHSEKFRNTKKHSSKSFLWEHKWEIKRKCLYMENYSILLILLLHIFKVSSQTLYKEIELERTLCRNWNKNIKDDKNEILVYVTGLLWGHNTKAIQNTGKGKVFFQAQAQWFQGLVQSLQFP